MDAPPPICLITAYQEAPRLQATLQALAAAFPGARLIVADDHSSDGTDAIARAFPGAELVRAPHRMGKGGVATLAAARALDGAEPGALPTILLCDGDLAESAGELRALVAAVEAGECDLAVAVFASRVGGGFGLAVGYAHRVLLELTGLDLQAPISGQRAMRGEVLAAVVPFAPRFGMEIGMTVDAHRAGYRVGEVVLPLAHRATGRSLRGFLHRGRQLRDFVAVARDLRAAHS